MTITIEVRGEKGAGKTTTILKLAKHFKSLGYDIELPEYDHSINDLSIALYCNNISLTNIMQVVIETEPFYKHNYQIYINIVDTQEKLFNISFEYDIKLPIMFEMSKCLQNLNYSVLIPDYESTAELLNLLISDCKVSKNNIIKFVEYEF